MITYLYDGTFEGFLTTVFDMYSRKRFPDAIFSTAAYTPFLMEEKYEVATDISHAKRVVSGIEAKGSATIMEKIYNVYLSEHPSMELLLVNYIRLILERGAQIEYDYRQPEVLRVKELNKQIHREVHRMHAFVRFQKTTDNLYYATVVPDFNVLPLIGEHFEKRYSDQHWMIFDSKRNYGLYYDQETLMMVESDSEALRLNPDFMKEEKDYEGLWKNYFQSVNITERKNVKLHLRHMPKRYWKYLTEKR